MIPGRRREKNKKEKKERNKERVCLFKRKIKNILSIFKKYVTLFDIFQTHPSSIPV
jgi:hypothetical protein